MAAHAKLGPSAAHRWFACPGSINASRGIANTSGIFAAEGTAAHNLAAYCLQNGFDTERFVGGLVSDADVFDPDEKGEREADPASGVFDIDDEMADAVQTYLDVCRSYAGGLWEHDIEQRLDLSSVHKDIFGTGDFVSYHPETKALVVVDYKHGKGVAVEVADNEQLLTYALGAALRYHNRGVAEIHLIVVQPRCPHAAGPVRQAKYDAVDLLEFKVRLADAAKATEAPDASLVAGEHCKFCPAASTCETFRTAATALAEDEFSAEVTSLDPVRVGAILKRAGMLKDWIKRVEEYGQSEAQHGRLPFGFKLVAKRATRKWRNADEAKTYLANILELDEADIMAEPKMKSPAKIEATIGKKRAKEIAGLWESISSGANLVPTEDARPELKPDAEKEFAE